MVRWQQQLLLPLVLTATTDIFNPLHCPCRSITSMTALLAHTAALRSLEPATEPSIDEVALATMREDAAQLFESGEMLAAAQGFVRVLLAKRACPKASFNLAVILQMAGACCSHSVGCKGRSLCTHERGLAGLAPRCDVLCGALHAPGRCCRRQRLGRAHCSPVCQTTLRAKVHLQDTYTLACSTHH